MFHYLDHLVDDIDLNKRYHSIMLHVPEHCSSHGLLQQ
ncbi:hypothetical protein ECW26_27160 [Escherichia coli W26]|nr:hypothetical protein ECW26_27160 [Escherichia coli W26]